MQSVSTRVRMLSHHGAELRLLLAMIAKTIMGIAKGRTIYPVCLVCSGLVVHQPVRVPMKNNIGSRANAA